jgi:hypothetical protein
MPATTSTLISGDRDAVLVDALLTTSEGGRLAAWVRHAGKQLRAIVVTHGHADHFFGAGPVLNAFPDARLAARPTPRPWRAGTPGSPGSSHHLPQCPHWPALRNWTWKVIPCCCARSVPPTARSPPSCTCRAPGQSAPATSSTTTSITGHKDPGAPDDNATRVLDQSRRYIEDFGQAVADSSTPPEVVSVMLAKYPAYGNRYTLFAAASTQFPS